MTVQRLHCAGKDDRKQHLVTTYAHHAQHYTSSSTGISVRVLRSRNWEDDHGVKVQ